jgi:hypothetical protein
MISEKLSSLRLLAALVNVSEIVRYFLYGCDGFLNIAGDILESGMGVLQLDLIRLLRNLLKVEVDVCPKCAEFAANLWGNEVIGSAFMDLHEAEDDDLKKDAIMVRTRLETGILPWN